MKRTSGFTLLLALISAGGLCAPPAVSQSSGAYRHPQRKPTTERYKEIQRALEEHGYDPGPIDGQWGSKTAAAVRQFERDHDMPADGRLDALVLITLGLGPDGTGEASSDTKKDDK